MPPRILIFVALAGGEPRAAAGAACELADAGTARPLSLHPAAAPAAILRAGDRLAADLDLRPVAGELATLAHVTDLLRERPHATVVLDAPAPASLVGLLSAADLARARLDAARPGAATSTLAAQRAAAAPSLPVLRAAAAAGDLLRAPELTSVGLVAGPHAAGEEEQAARSALTFAGLAVATELVSAGDPQDGARRLAAAGGAIALARDPAPAVRATEQGAELHVPVQAVPTDLRAVRRGPELALHAGGVTRRLQAPASLGDLVPGAVSAADDAIVVRFDGPSTTEAQA